MIIIKYCVKTTQKNEALQSVDTNSIPKARKIILEYYIT